MANVISKPRRTVTTAAIALGVFGALLASQAVAAAVEVKPSCSVRAGTTICTNPR
ncbi:hypothetical protein M8C13_01320 [Crossiella sp. SN42]|uniref:hypothetical protein n=1 Tax=Crossiella sp. SN42 TaxID=2944808 RepID=UPI00207CDC25|nr:hypothetical protein [Crossiella sp. SN42]MCO1574396.1 hypothetical protein [Crossiella sp. SN42]